MAAAADRHSDEFVEAARAEANRLRMRAERLRTEASRHLVLAEQAAAQAIALERRVRELDELLGRSPQLRLDLQTEALRGQQLRDTAVEIIVRRRKIGEPIHYRDWFNLMLAEGHSVEGKDPLATFLTQVTRSPVVLRQPGQAGVYRVDPVAGGEEALRELQDAEVELAELRRDGGPSDPRANGLSERLAAAERRVAAAERALSEVARVQTALAAT